MILDVEDGILLVSNETKEYEVEHDAGENVADLGQYAFSVMTEDNCTQIFENLTVAFQHNVTCLGHAPTLTDQVRTHLHLSTGLANLFFNMFSSRPGGHNSESIFKI